MSPLPPLPFFFSGDSYIIYLADLTPSRVKLLQIHRFSGNDSRTGVEEHFYDLPTETRAAVIQQINRRCPGKSVMI